MKPRSCFYHIFVFIFVLLETIGSQVFFGQQAKGSVSGQVLDENNRDPLEAAQILVIDTNFGSISDSNGFYRLNLPPGEYQLRVEMVGYESFTKRVTVRAGVLLRLDLFLQPKVYHSDSVRVVSRREGEGVFSNILSPRAMRSLPAAGEVDVMRAVASLPGVVFNSDVSARLFVRGSPSNQTLIAYDGVPIYIPYHLGGVFSMFNSDAVEEIEFQPGIHSVRYGGSLAGRLNVVPKTGNRKNLDLKLSLGVLSSRIALDGPLGKGSFFLAARRTYIDILERYFFGDTGGYYFYDLQGGYSFQLSPHHRFSIQGLLSTDALTNILEDDEKKVKHVKQPSWGNRILSLRWNYRKNERHYQETQVAFSNAFVKTKTLHIFANNQINDVSMKHQMYLKLRRHNFLLGAEARHLTYNYQWNLEEAGNLENIIESPETVFFDDAPVRYQSHWQGWQGSLFFEDRFPVADRVILSAGLRSSWQSLSGYLRVLPRLQLSYQLSPNSKLNAIYAHHVQYVYTLKEIRNEALLDPFSIYFPITTELKPLQSRYHALGGKILLPRQMELSFEGYYKRMTNIPGYDDQIHTLRIRNGKSFGLDILLRKEYERYFFSAGYSLGFARLTEDGHSFYAAYDRRHNFKFSGGVNLLSGWRLSGYWAYLTGLPYTPIVGKFVGSGKKDSGEITWYIDMNETRQFGSWGEIRGQKNSLRLPTYHRLDIAVSKSWHIKKALGEVRFQVLNVYNQSNPLFYGWNLTYRDPEKDDGKNFPIIPTLEVSIQF